MDLCKTCTKPKSKKIKVWKCNQCGSLNLFELKKYCHKCKSPKIWVEPEAKTGAQKTNIQTGTTIGAQKANVQTGTKNGAQKANVQTGTTIGAQKANVQTGTKISAQKIYVETVAQTAQTEAKADTEKANEMIGQPASK